MSSSRYVLDSSADAIPAAAVAHNADAQFYGLFKQANEGDNTGERPGELLDLSGCSSS